jgi:hypothetical protein
VGAPRKVWSPQVREDLANYTTAEFIALPQYQDWTLKAVDNIRRDLGIHMTPEARRRAYIKRDGPGNVATALEYSETIPDPTTPEAFEELVEAYAVVKDIDKKYDQRRHAVAVKVPGDQPVGVVYSGDWQLGSWGVAVRTWREDMRLIQDYRAAHPDSLYLIGMGDYVSNLGILNHRGSQFRDLVQPGFQLRLVRAFFTMTAGSWLGLLAGCHDTFSQKVSDIDTLDTFIRLAKTRHLWHGVELTLRLGVEKYVIRVRHRYRYNSSLNELNSQRQQAAMEGPADVIAHAHFHTAVSGTMKAGGKPTIMLRSGSYQLDDDYARQYVGSVRAEAVFPMVLFWANQHKTMLFHDFKDGLDYLATLRQHS